MKNKLSLLLALCALTIAIAGCSLDRFTGSGGDSEDTGSTADKKETAESDKTSPSSEKVLNSGIAECDELAQYVNDNSEEIEGSYLGKAIVIMYKNTILKAIEDGTENMKPEEKEKFAEICTKSLKELKQQTKK